MGGLAIMAVDPGGSTGVCCGVFRDDVTSVKAAVARARKKGALKAWELSGKSEAQAVTLVRTWNDFTAKAHEMGVEEDRVRLVIERFDLRQLAADLAPVEVTYGMLSLMLGWHVDKKTDHGVGVPANQPPFPSRQGDHGEGLRAAKLNVSGVMGGDWLVWQMPSVAMTDVTNDRLRRWGAWVIGSEHARDAVRHCLSYLKAELL